MQKIAVGIDIGTYHVKAVIAERGDPRLPPRILGTGYAESRGLRHGYVVSVSEAARSIQAAVAQASRAARVGKIKRACLGIGGIGLDEAFSRGEAVVTRGDSEVSERDVAKAFAASEASLPPAAALNRRILHTIPLRYTVDGNTVIGRSPIGQKGMRVAVETLFITCLEQHVRDLTEAVETAGFEVEDIVASPLAASFVALTKTQKRVGCLLANIGAETLSIIVFEDNVPISIKVFPMGAGDITNDIALGLKISPEEADQLKMGAVLGVSYPRKKLEEIISHRLSTMFKLVEAHLKKIGKDALLPAGIILTGGGSGVATISDLAKGVLRLPSRVATLVAGEAGRMQLKDGSWAVAYGLTIWGFNQGEDDVPREKGTVAEAFSNLWKTFKRFLP